MRTSAVDLLLPAFALAAALLLFGLFVWLGGHSPVETWKLLFLGAFGDWYSWQNTLVRAAPLTLTALCVALPARAGLVIIGGEGALVLGGLAAAALPYAIGLPENIVGTVLVCAAGAAAGAWDWTQMHQAPTTTLHTSTLMAQPWRTPTSACQGWVVIPAQERYLWHGCAPIRPLAYSRGTPISTMRSAAQKGMRSKHLR
jgi:hypothetical protein